MSIMAESNVYESMVDDGLNEKLCLAAGCDASGSFMFVPKIEHDVGDAMLDGINDGRTEMFHDSVVQDTYDCIGQPPIYYEEVLSACDEVEVDYKPSLASMMLPVNKMETEWEKHVHLEHAAQDILSKENQAETFYPDATDDGDDSDEETIATFLTAAGQRLALYAVEDSDEVFAVAVYDESGDPPTNFQFLMKTDVERLIGEGAVRTVKKPRQMKKQLSSPDPPLFTEHEEEPRPEEMQLKTEVVGTERFVENRYDTCETTAVDDTNLLSNEIVHETITKSSPSPDADEQPDFNYIITENINPTVDAADRMEETREPEETTSIIDCDDLIEQSTVQCILFGDDDSDSELTLADVEETMKYHKSHDRDDEIPPKETSQDPSTNPDTTINNHSSNDVSAADSSPNDLPNLDVSSPSTDDNLATPLADNSPQFDSPTKFPKKSIVVTKKMTAPLICKRENFIDERFNVSSGTSLLLSNSQHKNIPEPMAITEIVQMRSKVKRSRKQQLTSVNRGDSEIIIQPANFTSEDEEPAKKRGRGKRKPGRPSVYKTKNTIARKPARIARTRTVEVIEIDVDENDLTKKDVVEITIDENKEKGSSDKENEVIMVGDSEDEMLEAESAKRKNNILKCRYCSKIFRQKRGLDTHVRVCPKSPEVCNRNDEKIVRRTSSRSNDSRLTKKQYSCKICQAKFDVVVALASHVRSVHSPRKKSNSRGRRTTKLTPEIVEVTKKRGSGDAENAVTTRRINDPRINNSGRSWKSKELHCDDCGRWFSSEALLTAHSLQHATKKSEKQTRRCQTCKKLFKSRLLYIRHMRMHSRAKQLQKKLHQKRQAASKPTALRKRGRPRKL